MLLHDPLPWDALAQLIDEDAVVVLGTLSHLHSLLAPSEKDKTFRVHHQSFLDFISDPTRCTDRQFRIDPTIHHLRIAKHCLRVMDHSLKPNLCGLQPNELHQDRFQILDCIQHGVSPCLAYACTYWASHLVVVLTSEVPLDSEAHQLLGRFASKHLLTWLEALSIIGCVDIAYASLDTVRKNTWPRAPILRERSRGDNTRGCVMEIAPELFNDGCRFIQWSSSILLSFPMQIYDSASFCPPQYSTFPYI